MPTKPSQETKTDKRCSNCKHVRVNLIANERGNTPLVQCGFPELPAYYTPPFGAYQAPGGVLMVKADRESTNCPVWQQGEDKRQRNDKRPVWLQLKFAVHVSVVVETDAPVETLTSQDNLQELGRTLRQQGKVDFSSPGADLVQLVRHSFCASDPPTLRAEELEDSGGSVLFVPIEKEKKKRGKSSPAESRAPVSKPAVGRSRRVR